MLYQLSYLATRMDSLVWGPLGPPEVTAIITRASAGPQGAH